MKPDMGHHVGPEAAAGLCHLVLVVGKDQVDAARMDVEALAEVPP